MDKPDWIHPQGNGPDMPPESGRPGRFQELEDEDIDGHIWGWVFRVQGLAIRDDQKPNNKTKD